MARAWTKTEFNFYQNQLLNLYVKKNLSIKEVGKILGISEKTVFDRLKRCNIQTNPSAKKNYLNRRHDVHVPTTYDKKLAEFIGIMLGDGCLNHFQTIVTLGTKEHSYAKYVSGLFKENFGVTGTISVRKDKYRDVYLGSTKVSKWLQDMGLVFNKVKGQVDVPSWIFTDTDFMKSFIKGFFDTDGSVYKLRFGIQISFNNHSLPLLKSLQYMLKKLEYSPSSISLGRVYLTKVFDVDRFFREIKPAHSLRVKRYRLMKLMRRSDSGYSSRL